MNEYEKLDDDLDIKNQDKERLSRRIITEPKKAVLGLSAAILALWPNEQRILYP